MALLATIHLPGQRGRFRELLGLAIDTAGRAEPGRRALSTLLKAHAARAEDALHGANQLSLSAQRAPTPEACDEGWRRVEAIVEVAEASLHDTYHLEAAAGGGDHDPKHVGGDPGDRACSMRPTT